jgi:hypothetical protein
LEKDSWLSWKKPEKMFSGGKFLLAQVDKSREPSTDKSRDISRAAPAMPSSIERVHCLLQRSVMKQVNVSIHASPLSLI